MLNNSKKKKLLNINTTEKDNFLGKMKVKKTNKTISKKLKKKKKKKKKKKNKKKKNKN